MPMLQHLLDRRCHLVDYERMTDDRGRRLVFFGRHAGLAGMIAGLLIHEGLVLETLGVVVYFTAVPVILIALLAGVGGIIITSQRRGPREHIYLVLVVIVVVAFLTDKLWVAAGRRLFPYREATR